MLSVGCFVGLLGLLACGSDDSGGTGGGGGATGGSGGATGGSGGSTGGTGGATGGSAGSATGGSGGSATGGSGGTTSGTGCDPLVNEVATRQASLGCTVDSTGDIRTGCEAILSYFPQCQGVWDTWVQCIHGKPDSDWACDGSNKASPNPGVCQTEYDAISACTGS